MKNNQISYIYEARVGAFGSVTFFRDPDSGTFCFTFFNGEDYTPLYISADAAYYVWAFIGCEHPDCTTISTFTPPKKAGRGKPKKRPSLTTKKKAKSK